MIEDDLRALLIDRADGLPDNAGRVRDVHDRIGTVRHRRTAGAALALVLVALAGFALTRLPGRPQTLPTGSPPGPYFTDDGSSLSVGGYRGYGYFAFSGEATWSVVPGTPSNGIVVVARCAARGDLRLTDPEHRTNLMLRCEVPVGDHWEGALPLDTATVDRLVAPSSGADPTGLRVRPSSPGDWMVGMLGQIYPTSIRAQEVAGYPLNGFTSPNGGLTTVTVTPALQSTRTLTVAVLCVRGVQLEITVDNRPAGTLTCDDAHADVPGAATYEIRDPLLQQLGLSTGKHVTIGVRPLRSATQWAVLEVF